MITLSRCQLYPDDNYIQYPMLFGLKGGILGIVVCSAGVRFWAELQQLLGHRRQHKHHRPEKAGVFVWEEGGQSKLWQWATCAACYRG